jgi:uncharacterized membrane protein
MNRLSLWQQFIQTNETIAAGVAVIAFVMLVVGIIPIGDDRRAWGDRLSPQAAILVGAVLRLARLGAQNLWYDEAFTAWAARLAMPDLVQAVAGDVHPPLWYLVETAAVRFLGNTEWALRLPAALCSIAALALVPRLARALHLERRAGAIATWIMALAPFQIWYAQEARMYALLLLLVEVGALGVFEKKAWVFFTAGTLALFTHNIGAIYFLALGALELPHLVRVRPAELAAYGAILTVYAPWASIAAAQAGAVAGSFWVQRPTIGAIPLTLHELFWGSGIVPGWAGVGAVLWSGLAVSNALLDGWKSRRALIWLALAPVLITWAVSQWTPILVPRLMIGATPFLALLLADSMGSSRRARVIALAGAPLLASALTLYFFSPAAQRGSLARFVEPVREQYTPGDAVLHTCIPSYILLSYYAPEMDHYLWRQANDLSQSLTDQTKAAMSMRETTIEALLAERARVWVYFSDSPVSSQAEIDETARIQARYHVPWSLLLDDDDMIRSGVYLVENR